MADIANSQTAVFLAQPALGVPEVQASEMTVELKKRNGVTPGAWKSDMLV